MEVKNFTEAEKNALLERYARMSFANLKKNILQDLRTNSNESVLYKKYKREEIIKFLETPQKHEKEIREYKVDRLRFKPKRRKESFNVSDEELKELEALERQEGKSKFDD